MNINARLSKIEQQLLPQGCPACAELDKRREAITGAADPDLDEWLHLYLARCPKCGKQRAFVDVTRLADAELEQLAADL